MANSIQQYIDKMAEEKWLPVTVENKGEEYRVSNLGRIKRIIQRAFTKTIKSYEAKSKR